jgi:hypothetical protein
MISTLLMSSRVDPSISWREARFSEMTQGMEIPMRTLTDAELDVVSAAGRKHGGGGGGGGHHNKKPVVDLNIGAIGVNLGGGTQVFLGVAADEIDDSTFTVTYNAAAA